MIRQRVTHIFNSWSEFLTFLSKFEEWKTLESIDFHQDGHGQVVVRITIGEPDVMIRNPMFFAGEVFLEAH